MSTSDDRLWVVVGPTASGKTELALELCAQHDGEIISADSVQVYRYFDIGTGKSEPDERARVPQHLVDIVEPSEPMDAARFTELAERAIVDIRARGKRPIVCGGTFLWVRALIHGLAPAPPADPELRARHRARVEASGRSGLHAELARVDAEAAHRLAPNDFVRVSRALEVFELTGVRMSQWQAAHGFRSIRHQYRLLGVERERSELDQRISARCRSMLRAGWVDEAARLLALGHGRTRAFASVGYKQIAAALLVGGTLDLESLELSIVRATRTFARRQRTWLRDQPIEWLSAGRRAL